MGKAPRPLRIGVTDRTRLHGGDEVAIQQVLFFRIREFGIKKFFDGFVVALADVVVYLIPRRSKSCPAQQVRHQGRIGIVSNGGSH